MYTNATKRRAMMEKRMRKEAGNRCRRSAAAPPGTERRRRHPHRLGLHAGRHRRSPRPVSRAGNCRQPIADPLARPAPRRGHPRSAPQFAKRTIIVENNYSGQFARYLRGETSFVADGHIRKYDGEPFMPHHIVEAVREQLAGDTQLSVPAHEIMV
jgi:2-oxoglutarate ferredoxin oxidoreductase subunit alpha